MSIHLLGRFSDTKPLQKGMLFLWMLSSPCNYLLHWVGREGGDDESSFQEMKGGGMVLMVSVLLLGCSWVILLSSFHSFIRLQKSNGFSLNKESRSGGRDAKLLGKL